MHNCPKCNKLLTHEFITEGFDLLYFECKDNEDSHIWRGYYLYLNERVLREQYYLKPGVLEVKTCLYPIYSETVIENDVEVQKDYCTTINNFVDPLIKQELFMTEDELKILIAG